MLLAIFHQHCQLLAIVSINGLIVSSTQVKSLNEIKSLVTSSNATIGRSLNGDGDTLWESIRLFFQQE